MSKGALGLLAAYWPEGLARYGHVPLERVTQACVHKTAAAHAERVALASRGRTLRYDALAERVRACASGFAARSAPGARVAIALDDPLEALPCGLGALDADRLALLASRPDPARLARFEPALVVTRRSGLAPPGAAVLDPDALAAAGDPAAPAARPNLRDPVLALARPGGGEVLHNHKTLLATALAFAGFYLLEPGAELALCDPPEDWLGIAALLGGLVRGGLLHAAWEEPGTEPAGRVDYAVMSWATARGRFLEPGSRPWAGRVGVGAIVGVEAGLALARRRRLARRLRTAALTVYGRNDLGPVLASHPTWFLDDAVGIPLPNVDCRPLDPADGRELAIGWDAVEEAEVGVKSALAPAGGELAGRWLRTRERAHVDPTGAYFLVKKGAGHD